LYEQGRLDDSLPFERLHALSNIDARAKAATHESFCQAIRVGLPNPRRSVDAVADPGPWSDGIARA
jgi:hypothetical protein